LGFVIWKLGFKGITMCVYPEKGVGGRRCY
jgi:hypothetical protein